MHKQNEINVIFRQIKKLYHVIVTIDTYYRKGDQSNSYNIITGGFQLLLLPFFSIKTWAVPNDPKAKSTSKHNEWGYELKLKPELSQFSVLTSNSEEVFVQKKKKGSNNFIKENKKESRLLLL